ncbi:NTP transferase domain-containing protein [Undibacterium arcticum]|uniref:NTP transferase domain-containing protein n=1 Tax=Undibacterium arcticum TaxID=1762892 RepID=A0ABV7F613_9BURK
MNDRTDQGARLRMAKYPAILLAAGQGARFDPSGLQDKLLQVLPSGVTVAGASASHLLAAVPTVVAVLRPGADQLAAILQSQGCVVTTCPNPGDGMAMSLAHGLRHALAHTPDAKGCLIALADMPYLRPATLQALLAALEAGADIAAPVHHGQRGNPVGFSCRHLPRLLQLQGDQGARSLLKACAVTEVEVDDPGILHDIDTPADLT